MTPPTTAAATVRDVTMRFRGHTALDGVSTVIGRDSITGLLGRNGAGKTTLMQLLTGHRVPTSGSIEVLGGAPYENEGVLSRICFVKEGQRYPTTSGSATPWTRRPWSTRTGTPTSPPACCGTSTCRSSGRSRSSPAA
jgi:ABC-type cobalamin/Fe3+-siderophores transport system ATPase subunit